MNKVWSGHNKKMQTLIAKEESFRQGIEVLFELRGDLFRQIRSIVNTCPAEAFWQMPFAGVDGYHSKTLVYSMWHIFRIEDITAHTLILNDEQILFKDGWLEKTKSPIITTGNELKGEQIAEFSKQLDVKAVFDYCKAVMDSTDKMLKGLEYKDLKRTFRKEDKERLMNSQCISVDEDAFWLIGFWCGKSIEGLIRMPFSRHWIMHVEAMCRIRNKLCDMAKKGTDPIAYCGLSCGHCFLKEFCGYCRSAYNTCSYATLFPGNICPNAACCREKGIDGCYECEQLEGCMNGFYGNGKDGRAAKAVALFIRRYGKKELADVMDHLHEKYDFKKIQEIIGYDTKEGLKILEENRNWEEII